MTHFGGSISAAIDKAVGHKIMNEEETILIKKVFK